MKNYSRVIVKGGVLAPGELKSILEVAERNGLSTIAFGSRQDILFLSEDQKKDFKTENLEVVPAHSEGVENIVSSYVSSGIFGSTAWLTADRYLYILEQFQDTPKLKINITDARQRLVPLFTGHLNFIASEHEDYWYLYLRLPHWEEQQLYPVLIYSWDLARIALTIEKLLREEPGNATMVFDLVIDSISLNSRTISQALQVDFQPFPYYEGMNRLASGNYWLGLYWRNNRYDIAFLKALCDLCTESQIGKISLTPFKSFIVKGIPAEDKLKWEKFLGLFGINVRHSMLELNWHVPVANDKALRLKEFLVNEFNKNDISTYGLTFGITEYLSSKYYFTSIVIEVNKAENIPADFAYRDTFNITYARDFDPNTREYVVYVQDVDQAELPGLLMELSRLYFENLGNTTRTEKPEITDEKPKTEVEVYQCNACMTLYDVRYGDALQNIKPGVAFESLPEDYRCSLCEGPKDGFVKITQLTEAL
ncbi:rubredoxin [Leeuwenhoekiella nanhaiensis]|uniref:Rubredoxin n=1 Tax=Leeuwenhoekiella nanhaiensis TaxID=1655491 RepID=A0A2G1VW96_9FLAO|nr:rubredoxin [Leeuwenhoekiella nanhaiensis]PHQ31057.1 rubredoxin [Leeuwenhoekiella nanhaiensis]